MLPAIGYAVFIYDRRGSGRSTGKRAGADFNTLADDGVAALRMLAADKRIDAKKVGFWGLSRGGWLSVLAASRAPQAAFAISISAPLTTADVQMNFAVRQHPARSGGSSNEDIQRGHGTRPPWMISCAARKIAQPSRSYWPPPPAKPWFQHSYIAPMLPDPARSQWAEEMAPRSGHDPQSSSLSHTDIVWHRRSLGTRQALRRIARRDGRQESKIDPCRYRRSKS